MLKQFQESCHILYLAAFDPRTPWTLKLMIVLIVAYLLSPIDLIPDFIPVIGFLDELILLPFLIKIVLRYIPEDLREEYKKQRVEGLSDSKLGYIGVLSVILIWLITLFVITALLLFLLPFFL